MSDPAAPIMASPAAETPTTIYSTSRLIEPVALVYSAAAVAGFLLELTAFQYVAAAYAGAVVLASIAASRGRVAVGPEGISARYLIRRVHIPWDDVWAMNVVYGVLQRYVNLRRRDGRRFALPAIRAPRFTRATLFEAAVETLNRWSTGRRPAGPAVVRSARAPRWLYVAGLGVLMAAALAIDRPWYWVTIDAFAEAPDPCAVLAQGPAAAIGLSGQSTPERLALTKGLSGSTCRWTAPRRTLDLSAVLVSRVGLMSGTGVAADILHEEWWWGESYARERTEGLDVGDGGRITVNGWTVSILARHHNVLILVEYYAADGRDNRSEAIDIARQAVEGLAG